MMDVMAAKRKVKPPMATAPRRSKSAHGKSKINSLRIDSVSAVDLRAQLRKDIVGCELAQSIRLGNDAWEAEIVASLHMLAKLEPVVANTQSRNRELWEERHRRFHDALAAACPSPWLLRFREVLFVQSQRYRTLSMLQSQKP